MRAKKNAWHCDPSTCEPRSIWSRQWCHSILSFFFDGPKSGYGPISENEIDSKSFNYQVIEALVCLNLLAGNLICWSPLKSKQPIDRSLCRAGFLFSRLKDRTMWGHSSCIKWIVSSWNWHDIELCLELDDSHTRLSLELNAEHMTHAVDVYVDHCLQSIAACRPSV